MSGSPILLVIGTVDTKSDEIGYLKEVVERCDGRVVIMDVGVLGRGHVTPDIGNEVVAGAAGLTLQQVRDSGDENSSMAHMARGAAKLACEWHAAGRIHGLLALGGTMGTDLALDVAAALPVGVPKVLVSTIAYSHLLPPERIAPDLTMVLWAGGLYGLNSLCRSALAQAAGAAVGACRSCVPPDFARPVVGMTSLGSSALGYMKAFKPQLDRRGFDLAVFHTTGPGGRAFETLARQGRFAAVMDFSLQELVNHLGGSCVTAGADRLLGAGAAGVPQIVAPGATDMVDYPAWGERPERFPGRPAHAHNRLIASVCVDPAMRRLTAAEIGRRLGAARGPTALILPLRGIEAWDRPGEALHDPEGLAALIDGLRISVQPATTLVEVDAHINDDAFVAAALQVFDAWVADGRIRAPQPSGALA
jgi:uncharacterized protein (UPF0261 family)